MWPPHLKEPTGRSTKQIEALPFGSVFVINKSSFVYHAKMMSRLGRADDVTLVFPKWIEERRWIGKVYPAIEVDHAVPRDEEFDHLLARARRHCCISVGASA